MRSQIAQPLEFMWSVSAQVIIKMLLYTVPNNVNCNCKNKCYISSYKMALLEVSLTKRETFLFLLYQLGEA